MTAHPTAAHSADGADEMPWAGLWRDLCDHQAERFGDKTAFVNVDGSELSFAAFRTRVYRLNNAVARMGLRKGDRVAILAKNRTEYVEVYGLASSGIITVPLNWRLTAAELLPLLEHSAPALIVADEQHAALIDTLLPGLRQAPLLLRFGAANGGWQAYEEVVAAAPDTCPAPDAPLTPDDTICLMYTSGTTGAPKGVALSHRGILGNARLSSQQVLGLTPQDRTLAAMPFFHAGGMWYHLHPSYAAGCTSVILPGFDAERVLATLERAAITNVHLVPTMIGALLAHPAIGATDLGRLRLIFYAASSIPLELLKRALAAFAGCALVQSYGSTEAGMVTVLTSADHARALAGAERLLASCGRAIPGNRIRVVDHCGAEVVPGAVGEIVVRGASMMSHYWNNQAATAAGLHDGWFQSGDLGYCDDEGYVYLVDRKNDMIVTGGENVYPSEVEAVLNADPDIEAAAVFGLPDPVWVERVVAAVVPRAGAVVTGEQIIARVRERLAAYKCPKQVFLRAQLPLNAVGKISKKDLRLACTEVTAGQGD
jgi:acyl-CoA synthetase (AMP-forming)/AMP-acid ligase II